MHSNCLQESACGHACQEGVASGYCILLGARLDSTDEGELGAGPLLVYTMFMDHVDCRHKPCSSSHPWK